MNPHENVYCRLAVSKIHGVGVGAVVNIPKGTIIFMGNEPPTREVPVSVVESLPKNVQRLYNDFSVRAGDKYICPDDFNELTVGWFFNDSDEPNIDCIIVRSRTDGFKFVANRDIVEGEELTMNYHLYEKLYMNLHYQKG